MYQEQGELFATATLARTAPPPVVEEHGEVFTRPWVVEGILDLVGCTPDRDLAEVRIAEPACGSGAFLRLVARRVSASCRVHGRGILDAAHTVHALDLLERNVKRSRQAVAEVLTGDGWPAADAEKVAHGWVQQGDYLLRRGGGQLFDMVVGNPPYVRLEHVPETRMRAYRAACPTMGGRADLYVGFYELGLRSLRPGGRLGFICADRWMRNQYGRRLRRLVEGAFSVDTVLVMHDADAFQDEVAAYPAITVLGRGRQGTAVTAEATGGFDRQAFEELRTWIADAVSGDTVRRPAYRAARLPHWFTGQDSWPAGSPERLAVLETLDDRLPLLEDPATGTRVGIGVATGADKVFLTRDADLVERDRLLPLAMTADATTGALDWQGTCLVNPWDERGVLVDLRRHPRLRAYFARHSAALHRRYVARKDPARWYRTIDRVDPTLTGRAKLLIPDMKTRLHPVLDPGGLYPHHNLYYVVSDEWDLRVLGGLLMSRVAQAFVEAYSVRMRGGTLRFQAQYLRRIRVPRQDDISRSTRTALADAFTTGDAVAATVAALDAYGLDGFPD